MAGVAKLFDGNILNKSKDSVDLNDDKFKGKTIGLYFSAHWCPPCRSFTPVLIKFYKDHSQTKNFEIIFISSDRDDSSFNSYYEEMPWLTLDFKERKKKEELGKKFNVTGIPTLILLDGDSGDVLCSDARNRIQTNAALEDFPWRSS